MPAPTRRAANPSAHPPQPTPANPSLPLWQLLAHCADAVQAVRAGRSLTDALEACPAPARPGTQALSFAVMRRLGLASRLRALLVPRAPAPWVDGLLCSALALACGTEYPAHTLVDQAVDAAKRKARPASGMVNAVLRRFLREQASLISQAQQDPTARWNHPAWWIKTLQHDWPDHWPALLEANQHAAPMMLRVHPGGHGASQTPAASPEAVPEVLDAPGASTLRAPDQAQTAQAARAARAAYQQALEAMGVRSQAFGDAGLLLDQARPVQQLPGFAQGWVSVQDASAQRAAPLLISAGLQPGARVLDACSAPGGKTAHLLETLDVQLLALDVDAQRLQRVDETLARLHLSARTQVADAAQPSTWWDGQCFDAIVLDAPCSASGIVRRHPDVRWLRRASDIQALADTQDRLLDALWPLLAPDGLLLYCTCSVFRQEGQDRIDAFLQRQPLALPLPAPGHLLPVVEYPTGPLDTPGPAVAANTLGDGFFYALLRKPGPAL